MERLTVKIDRIIFHNELNGYTVLAGITDDLEYITAVGSIPYVREGSSFTFEGEWTEHKKFGTQFAIKKSEEQLPVTVEGIKTYLGSGFIKGIGEKYASLIVEQFGKDTFDIIENDPERLIEVNGIGKKRIEKIIESWNEHKDISTLMMFLCENGVSASNAAKIFKSFGKEGVTKIKDNPYCLTEVWGIGFKTADKIAINMGVNKNSGIRLENGIKFALRDIADNNGDCYSSRAALKKRACELLEIEDRNLDSVIDSLISRKEIILDKDDIYLPAYYYAETTCAKIIDALRRNKRTVKNPDNIVNKAVAKSDTEYHPIQIEAIRTAITSNVMVLTGGPGTGKTTTINAIISAFKSLKEKVLLAAPTGRAAKRMSEATGMEAKTIHRLLEYNHGCGFLRDENNPIEGDALIVDECSMMDIILMQSLLKAIPKDMRLILVGDIDQLPSVGAGNVLRDIIDSNTVPVIKLTYIFRQAGGSLIIDNSHRINMGKMPVVMNTMSSDFLFQEIENDEDIVKTIADLCKNKLPKYYKIDPISDVQVLAPMHKGVCGTDNLNTVMQDILNPDGNKIVFGEREFRIGDKVMQIKNNYDKNVFNGDVGIVIGYNNEDYEITVDFDNRMIKYDKADIDEIRLAYAVTIHKSQGSEYPIVIMPITTKQFVMLQRNLLYTGITRAKKLLIILGNKKAIQIAVRNNRPINRNTKLSERLKMLQVSY